MIIFIHNIGRQVCIDGIIYMFSFICNFPGVLEEIYKRWRCADGQKGRRKKQPVNPDWLGIAKVKERIRNVVKHTNQSRKERLTKATGASAGFMKQYATVAEKVEVRVFSICFSTINSCNIRRVVKPKVCECGIRMSYFNFHNKFNND